VCGECGATFTRKSNIDEYVRKHTKPPAERRTFVCPIEGCASAFTRKSNLQTHLETIHAGLQPHCCPTCGKDFRYPSLLQKHMQSHLEKVAPEVVELGENWMDS
jgi:uncharacterized Zn-finger protein